MMFGPAFIQLFVHYTLCICNSFALSVDIIRTQQREASAGRVCGNVFRNSRLSKLETLGECGLMGINSLTLTTRFGKV
ncbi:hypothetical protein P153DRAFT_369875 [Dothidotthia symphoricarpi CBS 119687]|uniref:Secreted protein n=1 Tax=Dothidotthia symphoricarpi CBS 119687 TaxID=1392245 RepID=A0A6A6A1J1_9PLEO|nr:uncharacterized protein P153DRAFT_369875 [Dothidotthia symphoricarpi CBS 119687]KAF2125872.1 hypothetical protein P153DRAFT_369875 [Dothidotthia symphoricarpi CBS 119687]